MDSVRRLLLAGIFAAGCMLLSMPQSIQAQAQDTTHCCTVVRIDVQRAIVIARETATGYTFRVEVKNRKHVAALKVGDKVWANFAAKKVRLEAAGDSLCCAIVAAPPLPDPPALPAPNTIQ